MGDCAHDPSVLENGTAAHSLHNSSGKLQKLLVCHPQQVVLVRAFHGKNFFDPDFIASGLTVGQGGKNFGVSLMHFVLLCRRQRFFSLGRIAFSENSLFGVGRDLTDGRRTEHPSQLSRKSLFALLHRSEPDLRHASVRKGQNASVYTVANSVSQTCKNAFFPVIIGDRANACHAVPYMHAQHPAAFLMERDPEGQRSSLSLHFQVRRIAAGFQKEQELSGVGKLLSVHLHDQVACLQSCFFRRASFLQTVHQSAFGIKPHAKGCTARNQHDFFRLVLFRFLPSDCVRKKTGFRKYPEKQGGKKEHCGPSAAFFSLAFIQFCIPQICFIV